MRTYNGLVIANLFGSIGGIYSWGLLESGGVIVTRGQDNENIFDIFKSKKIAKQFIQANKKTWFKQYGYCSPVK